MEFVVRPAFDPITDVYEVTIVALNDSELGLEDCFSTFTVGLFHKDEEEKYLIDLIETLNRMKKHSDPETFSEVDGFNRWFDSETVPYREWIDLGSNHHDLAEGLVWPCDVWGMRASMNNFSVTFADWAGRQCPVQIIY